MREGKRKTNKFYGINVPEPIGQTGTCSVPISGVGATLVSIMAVLVVVLPLIR